MLGRAVDAHLRRRAQACHRGGVDDSPAALGQQQRQLVLHAQPHPFDVDAHDGVELCLAALGQAALLDFDTGIVVGIVQATVGLNDLLMQPAHISVTGHVTGHEQRLATGLVDQRCGALTTDRIKVGYHHLEPLTGKRQSRRPADTRRTASDQCYLAGKGHAHRMLQSWVQQSAIF
ncbi:hypothetical protein D3C79_825180 [compost metagenome]